MLTTLVELLILLLLFYYESICVCHLLAKCDEEPYIATRPVTITTGGSGIHDTVVHDTVVHDTVVHDTVVQQEPALKPEMISKKEAYVTPPPSPVSPPPYNRVVAYV